MPISSIIRTMSLTLMLTGLLVPAMPGSAASTLAAELKEAAFTLDNVAITVRTPYLPQPGPNTGNTFDTATPGDYNQMAIASSGQPYGAFSITAAPFGFAPTWEAVPIARHGGAAGYLSAILNYSAKSGALVQTEADGPIASIFGQQVRGQVSLINTPVLRETPTPLVMVEWVVEAGPRLWIVRVEKELPAGTRSLSGSAAFLQSLSQVTISSDTLDNPTTIVRDFCPNCPSSNNMPPGMPRTGLGSPGEVTLSILLSMFGSALGAIFVLLGLALRRRVVVRRR